MRSNVSTMVKTYSCGNPRDLVIHLLRGSAIFLISTTSTVTVEPAVVKG